MSFKQSGFTATRKKPSREYTSPRPAARRDHSRLANSGAAPKRRQNYHAASPARVSRDGFLRAPYKGTVAAFRRAVWVYYRKHGRHNLPWRKTTNPYRLLVSEVMLQQTQVERVVPFYRAFLKQFPTAQALAEAPLARVLLAWQGLGYNRRAKMLQAAARAIAVHGVPRSVAALEELSGVGPYTARAVAAFAWNTDEVLIETNIRTAGIHHFFPQRQDVSDTEIKAVLTRALPPGRSREWHWALMDYGAYLKHSGISYNTHSRHYTKQSKFTGSFREARGVVLRTLAAGPMSAQPLYFVLGKDRAIQVKSACRALMSEALIKKVNRRYQLPT